VISVRPIISTSTGPIFMKFAENVGHRWTIWSYSFDPSTDIAMATNFVSKIDTNISLHTTSIRKQRQLQCRTQANKLPDSMYEGGGAKNQLTTGNEWDKQTGYWQALPCIKWLLLLDAMCTHDGWDGEIAAVHFLREPLDLTSCVAEDDSLGDGQRLVQITQCVQLPLLASHMSHRVRGALTHGKYVDH